LRREVRGADWPTLYFIIIFYTARRIGRLYTLYFIQRDALADARGRSGAQRAAVLYTLYFILFKGRSGAQRAARCCAVGVQLYFILDTLYFILDPAPSACSCTLYLIRNTRSCAVPGGFGTCAKSIKYKYKVCRVPGGFGACAKSSLYLRTLLPNSTASEPAL